MLIQFVPRSDFQHLSSARRIERILNLVQENKLVLIEGRLDAHEEAELIRKTMEAITDDFHGIELAVVDPQAASMQDKLRTQLAKMIGLRQGMTIVGPANLIKEMTHDPEKMHVLIEANV